MVEITIPRQMGLQVRKARTGLGLSQKELAHRAGVSERLVLALELGDAPGIRLDKLMSITRALGLKLYVDLPGQSSATVNANSAALASQTQDATPERDSDQNPLTRYQDLYDQLSRAAMGARNGEDAS